MKIFEFKWPKESGGETDWFLDEDLKSAKKNYLLHTGCGDLDGCIISDIPKKQWKEMYLLDINEIEPDEDDEDYNDDFPDGHNEDDYCCGFKIMMTFKDYAEKNSTPDMISTTAFE